VERGVAWPSPKIEGFLLEMSRLKWARVEGVKSQFLRIEGGLWYIICVYLFSAFV
jgi:hypothetical protein